MDGRPVQQAGESLPGEMGSDYPSYEKWVCPNCGHDQYRLSSVKVCAVCENVPPDFGVGDLVLWTVHEFVITRREFNTVRSQWEYTDTVHGWIGGRELTLKEAARGTGEVGDESSASSKSRDGESSDSVGGADRSAAGVSATAVGGSGGGGSDTSS